MKTLTISYLNTDTIQPHRIPYLRMRGHWLRRAGFDVGQTIRVVVEPGRLTITNEGGTR